MADTEIQEEQANTSAAKEAGAGTNRLDEGAYGLIRGRMRAAAGELLRDLEHLNKERRAVYGAVSTELLGSERISTMNNCVPRDMTPIGSRFLFGYNVHIGLRSETQLEDVFAMYEWRDGHLVSSTLDCIDDPQFKREFAELYKYYKNTAFAKFARRGVYLYMKFRIGSSVDDFKAFKWQVNDDGTLTYINNRGDLELHYPPQHEIEWKRLGRDAQRSSGHDYLSVSEKLFISIEDAVLTFRVEDNTDRGATIAGEPVAEAEQKLDDMSVEFAELEHLIILRIRPYREEKLRYYVFNGKTQELKRVDGLAEAAILLPENHGLIFPRGSYLNDGTLQELDTRQAGMLFERRYPAPNGEDFLFVFYNRADGVYVLLQYNLIEQVLAPPLVCNGFSIFDDGRLLCFRVEELAQKHHMVQIWRTPFMVDMPVAAEQSDSPLLKIGNREIVRCMAECHELYGLTQKEEVYADLYLDITRKGGDIRDAYFWLEQVEAGGIIKHIDGIRSAAEAAIDEYEKLRAVKADTDQKFNEFRSQVDEFLTTSAARRPESIEEFVSALAQVRALRGRAAAVAELPHCDLDAVEQLDAAIRAHGEELARGCVEFLLRDDALDGYRARIDALDGDTSQARKAADLIEPLASLDQLSTDLEMLIDVVVNLEIEDSTQSTRIVESISAQFTDINRVRAGMRSRRSDLARGEGEAEFRAQLNLVQQSLLNYLELADTPARCDEYTTKLLIQIEELEARFADFDGFLDELGIKRDDVYNAFEQKKVALTEKLNKRALALTRSAERILGGIRERLARFGKTDEIFAWFSTDQMVAKLRDISQTLREELGDSTRADDLWTRLNTLREDALRNLKDADELFVDGPDRVKFGRQVFSVVRDKPQLSLVVRDDEHYFHVGGTQYFLPVEDEVLHSLRALREQEVACENADVYRAEFLAFEIWDGAGAEALLEAVEDRPMDEAALSFVRRHLGRKPSDVYVKGVHDHDAARILAALLNIQSQANLLAWRSDVRALAYCFYMDRGRSESMQALNEQIEAMRVVRTLYELPRESAFVVNRVQSEIARYCDECDFVFNADHCAAAEYLFTVLTDNKARDGVAGFALNAQAREVAASFREAMRVSPKPHAFEQSLEGRESAALRLRIAHIWLNARNADGVSWTAAMDAALLLSLPDGAEIAFTFGELQTQTTLEGMHGEHARIKERALHFDFHEFLQRLGLFAGQVYPRYLQMQERKQQLLEEHRRVLRLDKLLPGVPSYFVRNQLLTRVYLPMIGENFARQIGTSGRDTRSDRSGLLLLISPPGYGKTSLIEYVAKRLGMLYVKVDGPALGHDVTSLDPATAPNSAARSELQKLNQAFALGDNVMLYIDDIQHCNPEFLQKFIPLCDAQRRIEGVFNGEAHSFDLRGRRFAVVMAGNPYTESGSAFVIPDMLANRADVFNLGDISTAEQEAFELSFVENCLTSNAATRRMALTHREDVPAFVRWARSKSREGLEFKGSYSSAEMQDIVNVIGKLMRVRDTVLAVNNAYIRSAATAEAYRTEPPFQLQGSYRDMNKIAANVLAAMTAEELDKLVENHYVNEAQTLAGDSEANLLKWREIVGVMTEPERRRYEDIKRRFGDNQLFGGAGDGDPLQETIRQIKQLNSGVHAIARAISDYAGNNGRNSDE